MPNTRSQAKKRRLEEESMAQEEPIVKKPKKRFNKNTSISSQKINAHRRSIIDALGSFSKFLCLHWMSFFCVQKTPLPIQNCMDLITEMNQSIIEEKAWSDFQTNIVTVLRLCAGLQAKDEPSVRIRSYAKYLVRAVRFTFRDIAKMSKKEKLTMKKLNRLRKKINKELGGHYDSNILIHFMRQESEIHPTIDFVSWFPKGLKRDEIIKVYHSVYKGMANDWLKFYNLKDQNLPLLFNNMGKKIKEFVDDVIHIKEVLPQDDWKRFLEDNFEMAMDTVDLSCIKDPKRKHLIEERYLGLALLKFHKSIFTTYYNINNMPDLEYSMLRKTKLAIAEVTALIEKNPGRITPYKYELVYV